MVSSSVKKDLLIEALSYIKRFRDRIIVIKYGGAAMIENNLKQSFAEDIVLLQSLGMKPVIVHGGGPEVSKALGSRNRCRPPDSGPKASQNPKTYKRTRTQIPLS